jgi:putative glutathione S-transferase
MFNSAFDELGDAAADFYPPALRAEIDRINPLVYENVNNGVYRCGFAGTQEAYNAVSHAGRTRNATFTPALPGGRSHHGGRLAPVYHSGALRSGLLCAIQVQPVSHRRLFYGTIRGSFTKFWGSPRPSTSRRSNANYYASHDSTNPRRIVARGPAIDFGAPHDRDRKFA